MKYRLSEVISDFIVGRYGAERNELVHMLSIEFTHNRALRSLLEQVCDESGKAKQDPVVAMGQSMMYGIVIGILLEKDSNRKRIIT